jgi:acyl carrier protein
MATPDGADPTANRALLLAAFKHLATELVGKDFSHVSEITRLSELAVDSLGMVEIIGQLEQRFDIAAIPDDRLTGLTTVGDLLDVVEAHAA